MNKKLVKYNHMLIGALIICQLFIIMFQAMIMRDVQLFGLSVFEGFNIAAALVSLCLTIYTYPNKRVFLKYIPYVVALGAYAIVHGLHIYEFNSDIYSLQSPSFLVESYYIFRTFIVPLILIFTIYYSGIEKEQLLKIVEIFVAIIVVVMIVTNLFHIALRNYAETDIYNEYSLFEWFTFKNYFRYSYYELTTKGWFLSGNQMSAVLFMTFPIIVYRAYKIRDWYHYTLTALQLLSMFMLGTKTANVGCILVLLMFFAGWIVFKIFKHKERGVVVLLAITVAFGCLFPFSPSGYMLRYEWEKNLSGGGGEEGGLLLDKAVEAEGEEDSSFDYEKLRRDSLKLKKLDSHNLSDDEKIFVRDYMFEFGSFFGISPFIVKNYSDLDHSEFWTEYIQQTPSNDYRVLKTIIMQNIYDKNNNPLDKYLGMGYTLNYIYTELDYSYQFYSYGYAGLVLLIGPYFVLILYVIYKGLRSFKNMFTLRGAMYLSAPVLGLCIAKMSGHVLERALPLLILATTLSIVLLYTRDVTGQKETEDE